MGQLAKCGCSCLCLATIAVGLYLGLPQLDYRLPDLIGKGQRNADDSSSGRNEGSDSTATENETEYKWPSSNTTLVNNTSETEGNEVTEAGGVDQIPPDSLCLKSWHPVTNCTLLSQYIGSWECDAQDQVNFSSLLPGTQKWNKVSIGDCNITEPRTEIRNCSLRCVTIPIFTNNSYVQTDADEPDGAPKPSESGSVPPPPLMDNTTLEISDTSDHSELEEAVGGESNGSSLTTTALNATDVPSSNNYQKDPNSTPSPSESIARGDSALLAGLAVVAVIGVVACAVLGYRKKYGALPTLRFGKTAEISEVSEDNEESLPGTPAPKEVVNPLFDFSHLQRHFTQAVQLDQGKQYEKACSLYTTGLERLKLSIQYEKDPNKLATLRQYYQTYFKRRGILSQHLAAPCSSSLEKEIQVVITSPDATHPDVPPEEATALAIGSAAPPKLERQRKPRTKAKKEFRVRVM